MTMTPAEQRETIKDLARSGIEHMRRMRAIDVDYGVITAEEATTAVTQYVASMWDALVNLLGEQEARQLVEDATA